MRYRLTNSRYRQAPFNNCRVAMISDDDRFVRTLSDYLTNNGIFVTTFASSDESRQPHIINPFDLFIIELDLSHRNTLYSIKKLSSFDLEPGIIVASSDFSKTNWVTALENGADDVVNKSIKLREFLARTRAILRRHNDYKDARLLSQQLVSNMIVSSKNQSYLGWNINVFNSSITGSNGIAISLSRTELHIITALLKRPGVPISRSELSTIIKKDSPDMGPRYIDTIITRIRRKMSRGGGNMFIKTVSGVGYCCKESTDPQ